LIREKLAATQGSSITMNILLLNLQMLLELLFISLVFLWQFFFSSLGVQSAYKGDLRYVT
jgi:transposase, IS5 family